MTSRDEARRVRAHINTLCSLRETEAIRDKCVARADRSFDLHTASTRRRALDARCTALRRKLDATTRPTRDAALCAELARRFDRGEYAVYGATSRYGTDAHPVCGVAQIAPRWYVPTDRVRTLADMRACLRHVEARSPTWRATQLKATPRAAVPAFVSTSARVAPLQNLPAWQSARVTLVACALRPHTPRAALDAWIRALDVHAPYAEALHALREDLRTKKLSS